MAGNFQKPKLSPAWPPSRGPHTTLAEQGQPGHSVHTEEAWWSPHCCNEGVQRTLLTRPLTSGLFLLSAVLGCLSPDCLTQAQPILRRKGFCFWLFIKCKAAAPGALGGHTTPPTDLNPGQTSTSGSESRGTLKPSELSFRN